MILQNIVISSPVKGAEELCYRTQGKVKQEEHFIALAKDAALEFNTYFNLFSAKKWRDYTSAEMVGFFLEAEGNFLIELAGYQESDGFTHEIILLRQEYQTVGRAEVQTDVVSLDAADLIVCRMIALDDDVKFYHGSFIAEEQPAQRNVFLGIGICTFKREAYVKRNMELLKKEVFQNEDSDLKEHLEIVISDNAGTLPEEGISDHVIHIVKNKNLGGVGGFTRTMLEHMSQKKATHILLMDDDAVIFPEALERTYRFLSLLKEQYQEAMFSGALLRLDEPTLQYENGALWQDGAIVAQNHNFDMTSFAKAAENEKLLPIEYAGWWYCAIPVSFIRKEGLPLPLFIHRDDIEYGLRAKGEFISLNGVCVWHEAFENKHPGFLEYYDVRNLAIVNAIHNEQYSAKDFKRMLAVQVSNNIEKYRYNYVDLNLKAAVDFLKGFKWLYGLDTLAYHGSLAEYNYQTVDVEEFEGYCGLSIEELTNKSEIESKRPSIAEKIVKTLVMNGHFLPAKRQKVKVACPDINFCRLFRCKEVIFVDNSGKAVKMERNRKQLFYSYIKMLKTFRMIDRYYDRAVQDYREHYQAFISEEFWKRYLNIQ